MERRIRRVALELCTAADREGVRFVGPRVRQHSDVLVVENLDGVDMRALCARVRPAVVFLRNTSGASASLGSRLDVYMPRGAALYAGVVSRMCFTASAGALLMALGILLRAG
jgi:hypothetical protein